MTLQYNTPQAEIMWWPICCPFCSVSSPVAFCQVAEDRDLIHLVHAPLTAFVSLEELTAESAADSTLSAVREYVLNDWQTQVATEILPYA